MVGDAIVTWTGTMVIGVGELVGTLPLHAEATNKSKLNIKEKRAGFLTCMTTSSIYVNKSMSLYIFDLYRRIALRSPLLGFIKNLGSTRVLPRGCQK
jgi:hypothetical protein